MIEWNLIGEGGSFRNGNSLMGQKTDTEAHYFKLDLKVLSQSLLLPEDITCVAVVSNAEVSPDTAG